MIRRAELRAFGPNVGARALPHTDRSCTLVESASWGWLPALTFTGSVGVLLVALANALARLNTPSAPLHLWAGLIVLFVPIAARLLSAAPSRRERIGLLLVLGMGLYFVKLLQSPVQFTYFDEFLHWRTANDILATGHLFSENSLLPASALYPGLELVTTALVNLTGLSIFDAGIIVVGAARIVLMLGLFLLFEELCSSARLAGIATLLYATNPHYVFFDSQFAYESLALPLGALMLHAVARRNRIQSGALAWEGIAFLVLSAMVVTHHLTSYAFIALLVSLLVLPYLKRDRIAHQSGFGWIALFGVVASAGWLLVVASPVADYLTPLATSAVQETIRLILREAASRPLFTDYSGQGAPVWERIVSLGSVGLIVLGLPLGLLQIWRRKLIPPLALAFGFASLVYLAFLPLRFTAVGGEIAARSAEYLFIGIGFVLAVGPARTWLTRWVSWKRTAILAILTTILFLGGFILGAGPGWARLPGPYLVSADMRSIEPEGISAAEWAKMYLGQQNRIGTDRINRVLMGSYGEQRPVTNVSDSVNVAPVFFSSELDQSSRDLLNQGSIRYLVVDGRLSTGLPRLGVYFELGEPDSNNHKTPVEPAALEKFDRTKNVNRIYDSGNIVIYDLGAYRGS